VSALLDAALAAHPRAWREKYGEVVRGTLLDVADDRGGRVPVSETLPLALRGLWMRARGSVTFWAGLVVIAIQAGGALRSQWGYDTDGSLTGLLLSLNEGISYTLPVLALATGWAAARARAEAVGGIALRIRRLAVDSAPVLAAMGVGYAVGLVIALVRFGVPWFAAPGLLVILAQLAMVLAAIAIGQVLGSVLPRVLVIFAAPAAVIVVGMLLFGWLTPWNAMPWSFYPGIAYEVDARPVVRVAVGAGVIAAVALVVVAIRSVAVRLVPVAVLIGVIVAGATVTSATPAIAEPTPRAEEELVCSTDEPVICLWPEQEAAFGADYRADMDALYQTAREIGLPVDGPAPRSAARYGLTGIGAIEGISGERPEEFGLGVSNIGQDGMVSLYALSLTWDAWVEPEQGDGQMLELQHSIAVVLGVPADQTWLVKEDPFTGQRILDLSDAPDEQEARALVERWLTEGLDGARAPS